MANYSGSKYSNIARPYAVAAFDVAKKKDTLSEWKAFLEAAAYMSQDAQIATLLTNPEITSARLYELFRDVLKETLDAERDHFLHLLAENRRLVALQAISELYNAYYAKLEKISTVKVVTAIDIQDDFRDTLKEVLTKRIQHKVTLKTEIDPSIIGGAVIYIGDRVIDASIREQLTRLLESLR